MHFTRERLALGSSPCARLFNEDSLSLHADHYNSTEDNHGLKVSVCPIITSCKLWNSPLSFKNIYDRHIYQGISQRYNIDLIGLDIKMGLRASIVLYETEWSSNEDSHQREL